MTVFAWRAARERPNHNFNFLLHDTNRIFTIRQCCVCYRKFRQILNLSSTDSPPWNQSRKSLANPQADDSPPQPRSPPLAYGASYYDWLIRWPISSH